jgi:hypothetical protein
MTVLISPPALRAAPAPEPIGKIVILFDESASMNQHNAVSVAKLWVATFLSTFTRPYQIILAGFSETTVIHDEASTTDPAQIGPMREKVERLQAHGLVTDFEKPFAYLARNKESIALAILITDGEPEIWDEKSWYLSRTIRHDARYDNLNADYRQMRDGGASKEKRYRKLAESYTKRNLALTDQWLSMIKESPMIQLIVLDISGSHTYTRSWAEQAGGELVVADMESRDPQAALRSAFSTLQEKVSEALDEPLPPDATARIETGSPPSQEPVPQPASVKPAPPIEKKSPPRWDLVAAIVGALIVLAVLFIRSKRVLRRVSASEAVPPDEPALQAEEAVTPPVDFGLMDESPHYVDTVKRRYRALTATSLEAAHRYINDEISKAEKAGDEDRLQELMSHLRHGAFDRRVSLRIPAPAGAMDVVWLDADVGERQGGVIDISLHAALFDASDYRGEPILAIYHHPSDHRFEIQSFHTVERDLNQRVLVIENFTDIIMDKINWIELLTRLDNDQ